MIDRHPVRNPFAVMRKLVKGGPRIETGHLNGSQWVLAVDVEQERHTARETCTICRKNVGKSITNTARSSSMCTARTSSFLVRDLR